MIFKKGPSDTNWIQATATINSCSTVHFEVTNTGEIYALAGTGLSSSVLYNDNGTWQNIGTFSLSNSKGQSICVDGISNKIVVAYYKSSTVYVTSYSKTTGTWSSAESIITGSYSGLSVAAHNEKKYIAATSSSSPRSVSIRGYY